ncbi:TPA_asm: hypothetical protein [Porphyromonas phage phage022a_WW2931]|uniref:Terpenoid synthase n=1 Tax=Porphyromonas phage phage022a_WW2931 TaxID=3154112 RepID=A0AAT9JCY8_9CAUD|nr:hypothetical protein [Porphyromonas gingivalis]PDP66843.1 hypothetical protein CLI78_02240 [Porphyromonas gingivalis]
MNTPRITIETPTGVYTIPNRWSLLDRRLFLGTIELIDRWHAGMISPIVAQSMYVCLALDIDPTRIKNEEGMRNLYSIARMVDFLFDYNEDKEEARLREPVFARQLFPSVQLGGQTFPGYDVCTSVGMLSVDIAALRFIDALQALSDSRDESMLRLVLTLYCPGGYSPSDVHRLSATLYPQVSAEEWGVIRAVAFQFSALAAYIFRHPRYAILRGSGESDRGEKSEYALGMEASLYHLCADGIGTADQVEQLPILQYLELMRQKLIEGVRSMKEMSMEIGEIADKSRLDVVTVAKILQ